MTPAQAAALKTTVDDYGRRLNLVDGPDGAIAKEAAARGAGDRAIHRRLDALLLLVIAQLAVAVFK